MINRISGSMIANRAMQQGLARSKAAAAASLLATAIRRAFLRAPKNTGIADPAATLAS